MPRQRPEPNACHACGSTVDMESCSWRKCGVRVCVDHRKVCDDCGEVVCLKHAETHGVMVGEDWLCQDCAFENAYASKMWATA